MNQKYEKLYAEHLDALGEPFPEVVNYFKGLSAPKRVLDLGAGQGRDSLMIAKLGHEVHAVDSSPTGIAQLLDQSRTLNVTAEIADIRTFKTTDRFDIILIDRCLHMIGLDAGIGVINSIGSALKPHGEIFILDEKSNIPPFSKALRSLEFEIIRATKTSVLARNSD